jgi:hypothetical protein
MRNAKVTWQTQDTPGLPGGKTPDHFIVGLGVIEVDVPLTSREHLFADVQPGSYQGHVTVVAADGTELATPKTFSVDIVDLPVNTIPVPIQVAVIVI